jgi:hypothetical protein
MIALSKLPFPVAIATLALAWGSLGFAQAAAPSQARTAAGSVPAATPKPTTAELALKSRSTFSAAGETAVRNPFLPIGYVRAAGPVKVEAVMEVHPEQFTVTSTLLDVPALAVINGKSYEIGDKIRLDNTGKEFVTVKQIGDGVVLLEHRGQLLRCVSRARGGK